MKSRQPMLASLFLGLLLLVSSLVAPDHAGAGDKHHVCPPCGQSCDSIVFDAPGTCPRCGMKLVEQGAARTPMATAKTVAILLFPNVEIIDYTGPWELFGAAGYQVVTVASTRAPVTTAMGMTVVPGYTFDDAPRADILLVPGGGVEHARTDERTLRWVRETSASTGHTMSVCNGAFILASAGLLDGLNATTTAKLIPKLRAQFPRIQVVDDQRVVDNGRVLTTAGLSAGMDGALHLISVLEGHGFASKVALDEEYDWRPHSGFVRAALADQLIPDVEIDGIGEWKVASTEGDRDHWEVVAEGSSELSAVQVMDHIGGALEKAKWTRQTRSVIAGGGASGWSFVGHDGRPWTGALTLRAAGSQPHRYTLKLTISRVS